MLAAFVVVLRSLAMLVCGHRAVALENLALRQQLAVFKRTVKRPPLHRRDRLFWMLLATVWRRWRTALFVVHCAESTTSAGCRQLFLPVQGQQGMSPTTWRHSVVVVGRLVAVNGQRRSAGRRGGARRDPGNPVARTS